MKIKDGYNNKETEIRVCSNANGSVELWIRESGRDGSPAKDETLSYLTADELFQLYQEIKQAGKDLFD